MTQTARVLEYMKEHGSITQMDATYNLRVTRLASRIHDLTKMGVSICKRTEYGENEFGRFHYTRYTLEG